MISVRTARGSSDSMNRARNMPGVRYIWAKASILGERPDSGSVVLRYRT